MSRFCLSLRAMKTSLRQTVRILQNSLTKSYISLSSLYELQTETGLSSPSVNEQKLLRSTFSDSSKMTQKPATQNPVSWLFCQVLDWTLWCFGIFVPLDRILWHWSPELFYKIWRAPSYYVTSVFDKSLSFQFLSAGYLPLDDDERKKLKLVEENKEFPAVLKPHFYLYEKTISQHAAYPKLDKLDLLEVGCGQGGGLRWILSAHNELGSVKGLDICVHNNLDGRIVQGNAMELPFPDASFDIVLNVESSHQYPNRDKFYAEVARVLRPGGQFCYTDICRTETTDVTVNVEPYSKLRANIERTGLKEVSFADISDCVLAAREGTTSRYERLLDDAPVWMWVWRRHLRYMIERSYDWFLDDTMVYFASCWKKCD